MAEINAARRRALTVIASVFGLAAVTWLLLWVFVLNKRETTTDAYVAGNQIAVSSQNAGTVIAVLVDDTQRVEAGQALLRLDPTDAQVALERAGATLAQTVRQVRGQLATASQYDAQIESRRLELAQAEAQLTRRQPLLAAQAISAEELRQAETAVKLAQAALLATERQARAAHALTDGSSAEQNPAVMEARAAFQQAWVTARRNNIMAPATGYVARRTAQLGQHVLPGQVLLAIVPLDKLWVDANFKESQLRALRLGQPVEVEADVYGGKVRYRGVVGGVAAGTGSAFSLLPAQNASGNWIKVVQRVPVRIELDPKQLISNPLRLGLSTSVNVDTHDRSGPMLAPASAAAATTTDMYAQDAAGAAAAADAIISGQPLAAP